MDNLALVLRARDALAALLAHGPNDPAATASPRSTDDVLAQLCTEYLRFLPPPTAATAAAPRLRATAASDSLPLPSSQPTAVPNTPPTTAAATSSAASLSLPSPPPPHRTPCSLAALPAVLLRAILAMTCDARTLACAECAGRLFRGPAPPLDASPVRMAVGVVERWHGAGVPLWASRQHRGWAGSLRFAELVRAQCTAWGQPGSNIAGKLRRATDEVQDSRPAQACGIVLHRLEGDDLDVTMAALAVCMGGIPGDGRSAQNEHSGHDDRQGHRQRQGQGQGQGQGSSHGHGHGQANGLASRAATLSSAATNTRGRFTVNPGSSSIDMSDASTASTGPRGLALPPGFSAAPPAARPYTRSEVCAACHLWCVLHVTCKWGRDGGGGASYVPRCFF
jgi:hypothetical protein